MGKVELSLDIKEKVKTDINEFVDGSNYNVPKKYFVDSAIELLEWGYDYSEVMNDAKKSMADLVMGGSGAIGLFGD
ncbi:MAG: hypothetical protein WCP11_01335 [Candidatus Saccharibacteria bacterium]